MIPIIHYPTPPFPLCVCMFQSSPSFLGIFNSYYLVFIYDSYYIYHVPPLKYAHFHSSSFIDNVIATLLRSFIHVALVLLLHRTCQPICSHTRRARDQAWVSLNLKLSCSLVSLEPHQLPNTVKRRQTNIQTRITIPSSLLTLGTRVNSKSIYCNPSFIISASWDWTRSTNAVGRRRGGGEKR